jgi:hypothetical protein
VDAAVAAHGALRLGEHAEALLHYTRHEEPIQAPDDVVEAARAECRELLGDEVASRLARQLSTHPVIETASHHGPLVFPPFFQAVSIFGLGIAAGDVVPVFGTARGRLSDRSYPCGLRLAGGAVVTFFPGSDRAMLLSAAPALDHASITRACAQLRSAALKQDVGEGQRRELESILLEDFDDPRVLGLPTFSAQSTVINYRLWDRLHPSRAGIGPDLVCLELERVVNRVLAKDLLDATSLLHRVLFDSKTRSSVLRHLDGSTGCWHAERLGRMSDPAIDPREREKLSGAAGSAFFWGVNKRGRGIHLALSEGDSGISILKGIDPSGHPFSVPLTPEALLEGLAAGTLLPSLFVIFLVLTFARAFKCLGGIRQIGYLPGMQSPFAAALEERGLASWARHVRGLPTAGWTLGLVPILARRTAGQLDPAGPIEVLAAGGFTAERLARLREVTVADAFASILPTMYAMAPERDPELAAIGATDVGAELLDRLVRVDI